jgi:hypothetical protein
MTALPAPPSSLPLCLARVLVALVCSTPLASLPAQQPGPAAPSPAWATVDQVLGRKGAAQPDGVMKYSFPRSDLAVTVAGVAVKPALALGSWVAFRNVAGGHAMVMGDLVLTEDEVGPVMKALQAGGVEQTALHNHVLIESPRVMYMHISAHGAPANVAKTVHDALALTRTPLGAPPAPAAPSAADLDTAEIARTLGVSGKLNGVVYQVSIPRRETIREGRDIISSSMGIATVINFQPTGGGRAAITGDFVLRSSEVIRALRDNGIQVAALHSHMIGEEPRLFFMHFWANEDAATLARGLRAALDRTASRIAATKASAR